MKKLILTLLFIIPFLSGCASINANLSINNDKSAQFSLNMVSDAKAKPQELLTMKSNVKKFLNDSDYKIEDKSISDKVFISAQKKSKNLVKEDIDLSSLGFVTKLPTGNFIDVKHNFFVTMYNIDMVYDSKINQKKIEYVTDSDISSNDSFKPEYLQKYADVSNIKDEDLVESDFLANIDPNVLSNKVEDKKSETSSADVKAVKNDYKLFDLNNLNTKFSISLPSQASSNNAQIVNGNVYIWELSKTSPTEIRLIYFVYSGFAISFILLLGIGLIVYLAYRIYRHESLKRIGNNN